MNWLKKLTSSFLFSIARVISYLPFEVLYGFSRLITFILKRVINYRQPVIIQNLSRAFPELKYNEIKELSNAFYMHFSNVFIEVIKSITIPREDFKKRYHVLNPEIIEQYISNGQDVIGISGHIANWEWISSLSASFSFPCYTLYKPLSNKMVEDLMLKIRTRFGMRMLPMASAARFILNSNNKSSFYIFVADQSPPKNEHSPEYNFLNQPTTFFAGGAKLALARNAEVVYISVYKVKRGFYEVLFIPVDKTNKEYSEVEILKSYSKLLEEDIRRHPSNWLWSHKRWKH